MLGPARQPSPPNAGIDGHRIVSGVAIEARFPNPVIVEDAAHILNRHGGRLDGLRGATIVVTGASGFLCSYLVDILAAWNVGWGRSGIRVIAVDNFIAASRKRLAHLGESAGIELVAHDVTQPLRLQEKIDYVVHGASIASPVFYRRFPLETIDVNVNGTSHMLALAREHAVKGILFLSSSEIYGDPDPQFIPTDENYRGNVSCTGPRACYDESKRLGETLCVTHFRLYGTPVKIVRPFNVYGPGQRLDDQRIVPDLVSAALAGGPLKLLSDGRPTRSFSYARDFVTGLLLIMLSAENGEAFNLGNDEEISIATAAETVAEVAGNGERLAIEYCISADEDYLTDSPNRRCPDLSKVRSRIDWSPEVMFRDGITRTIHSYRT
jgi:UDP-glucuronate decarboxylase